MYEKEDITLVLSVCAVAFFASLLVFQSSAEEFTDGNFIYTLSDGLAFITGTVQPGIGRVDCARYCIGPVEQLPSTSEPGAQTPFRRSLMTLSRVQTLAQLSPKRPIQGVPEPERYTVVGISDGAFSGQTGITSAVLPSTVTYVGASAFSGCTAMASLSAPGLAQVSNSAFEGCSALSQFDFGRISSVGASAFRGLRVYEHFAARRYVSAGRRGFCRLFGFSGGHICGRRARKRRSGFRSTARP